MKRSAKYIFEYNHFNDRLDYYRYTFKSPFSHNIVSDNGDIFEIKRVQYDAK